MTTDSPEPCTQPELADLMALYALNVLSDSERAQVTVHVATCPNCQAQLAREQDTLAEVSRLAPPTALPTGMRERTLARAREMRTASQTPVPATLLAPTSASAPETPVAAPVSLHRPTLLPQSRPLPMRWQSRVLAIAAVLILVLLPWNVVLHTQLAQQQSATQLAQQTQQSLATILAAPHLAVYPLTGTSDAMATGHVYIDPDAGRVAVVASNLPQLSADHTYQAWLNHNGVRTSVGTFQAVAGSNAVLIGTLSRSLSYFQSLGVTIEPAGGSQHPSGPNVMLSSL